MYKCYNYQVLLVFDYYWNTTEHGLPSQSDPLVRGSLNIRTICRLVVYLYTFLLVPVPRPVYFPSHLVWLGLLLARSFLLARIILYDRERIGSMWIFPIHDTIFVLLLVCDWKGSLWHKLLGFNKACLYCFLSFTYSMSIPISIACQTVVFDTCFGVQMQETLPLRRSVRRRLLSQARPVSGSPTMSSRRQAGAWVRHTVLGVKTFEVGCCIGG